MVQHCDGFDHHSISSLRCTGLLECLFSQVQLDHHAAPSTPTLSIPPSPPALSPTSALSHSPSLPSLSSLFPLPTPLPLPLLSLSSLSLPPPHLAVSRVTVPSFMASSEAEGTAPSVAQRAKRAVVRAVVELSAGGGGERGGGRGGGGGRQVRVAPPDG